MFEEKSKKNLVMFDEELANDTLIKVIGVGGGGCNAVNRMIEAKLTGVEFIACNTDTQALKMSKALQKIQIGARITGGRGAGANPEIGRESAEEDRDILEKTIEGAEMLFITAGLGGGTGTGAAPVIAEIARNLGILVVGVVTKPFDFEKQKRKHQAEMGARELENRVETLIIIPNQKLFSVVGSDATLDMALCLADDVLHRAVRGIAEVIRVPGMINVDFADVKSVMSENGGSAIMGTGSARGEDRARKAATEAIESPLLEGGSIRGARGILLNISADDKLKLCEVEEIAKIIGEVADEEANFIMGTVIRENCDELNVTVIATGFKKERGMMDYGDDENNSKIDFISDAEVILEDLKKESNLENLDVPTLIRRKISSKDRDTE
jgi:cell division protein FtsZ